MENVVAKTVKLQADHASRAAETLQDSAKLAACPPRIETFAEGVELATASYQRAVQMQRSWLQQWGSWAAYAQSLEGADTVPKYLERTGNIALQAQAQMVSQVSEFTELMDNINISYRFWVSQQLQARSRD